MADILLSVKTNELGLTKKSAALKVVLISFDVKWLSTAAGAVVSFKQTLSSKNYASLISDLSVTINVY